MEIKNQLNQLATLPLSVRRLLFASAVMLTLALGACAEGNNENSTNTIQTSRNPGIGQNDSDQTPIPTPTLAVPNLTEATSQNNPDSAIAQARHFALYGLEDQNGYPDEKTKGVVLNQASGTFDYAFRAYPSARSFEGGSALTVSTQGTTIFGEGREGIRGLQAASSQEVVNYILELQAQDPIGINPELQNLLNTILSPKEHIVFNSTALNPEENEALLNNDHSFFVTLSSDGNDGNGLRTRKYTVHSQTGALLEITVTGDHQHFVNGQRTMSVQYLEPQSMNPIPQGVAFAAEPLHLQFAEKYGTKIDYSKLPLVA